MVASRAVRIMVIAVVLICTAGWNQVTKHMARAELSQGGSSPSAGGFVELTLAENPGAFLSLGASLPQAARTVLTAAVGVALAFLVVYLARSPKLSLAAFIGLALAWSGGISNLFDRVFRHGLVTDFLVLRAGPLHTGIFNLADLAIVMGLMLVVASSSATAREDEVNGGKKGAGG